MYPSDDTFQKTMTSQLYCGHCGIPECHAKNAAACRERDRQRALKDDKKQPDQKKESK